MCDVMTLPRLKTGTLHYNRAIVVACPKCNAEIGKLCIRIDGRGCKCHRMRVEEYERDLRQARALYKETMNTP